jgi:hypothetical protein
MCTPADGSASLTERLEEYYDDQGIPVPEPMPKRMRRLSLCGQRLMFSTATRGRKAPGKSASRKKAAALDDDEDDFAEAAPSSSKHTVRKRKAAEVDEDDSDEAAPMLKKRVRASARTSKKAAPVDEDEYEE